MYYSKLSCLFLIFVFSAFLCTAQQRTGTITGKVTDGKTHEALIGAFVKLQGTENVCVTDLDGSYILTNIPEGKCILLYISIGYKKDSIQNITVMANDTLYMNFEMVSEAYLTKDVKITAQRKSNTETAVVTDIKNSQNVVVGVSAQQISKTQDRDASEIVKRLPGVNIMNDRFIMVRGLNERYNSVMLNNVLAPSVEADRRSFAFDLIPAGMIENLLIYKTPSPELPGDFAGGAVKIITKNFTQEGQLSFNITGSYRPGSSFMNTYQNKTEWTDYLGYDNGSRNMPKDFPSTQKIQSTSNRDELTPYGRMLPNNWTSQQQMNYGDFRLGAGYTKGWRFGDNWTFGTLTALNYALTNTHQQIKRRDFDGKDTVYDYKDDQYTRQARVGVIQSLYISNGNHTLEFKGIYNGLTKDQVTFREGDDVSQGYTKQYSFFYQSRQIAIGQVNGKHSFFNDKGKFEWTLGATNSNRNEPDYRRVQLKYFQDNPTYAGDTGKAIYYMPIQSGSADPRLAGRVYSYLTENAKTAALNYEHKIELPFADVKILAGYFHESKTREFDSRWMGFVSYYRGISYSNQYITANQLDTVFAHSHIGVKGGFKISELTNPSDHYSVINILDAGYTGLFISILDHKLDVYPGIRIEKNTLHLLSKLQDNTNVDVNNPILSVLPSLNLTWHINGTQQLRVGYARTVNRPEFREVAPLSYYDFEFSRLVYGNPNLKTCTIDNYDMRYEWYPSVGEMITVGAFAKQFQNPIEAVASANAGNNLFTYNNAVSAYDYGAETEIRKQLNYFKEGSLLNNFSVVLNAAYIVSKVTLPDSIKKAGLAGNRPLQGQSPYCINTGIYYQTPSGKTQFNLMYNIFGPRIILVGYYQYPDVYELPRHSLDFAFTERLHKNINLRFAAQDILNSAYVLAQDKNGDNKLDASMDNVLMKYKPGSYYTVSLQLRF